jgi:hypothetical protein
MNMRYSPIEYVLAVLRLFRDAVEKSSSISASQVLSAQFDANSESPAYYRAIAVIFENILEAEAAVVSEDRLDDEAKGGILQIFRQLRNSLKPPSLEQPLNAHFNNSVNLSASHLAIAAGLFRNSQREPGRPADIEELVSEIDDVSKKVEASGLEPVARKVLTENLAALAMFLKGVHVFGFDAAYAAYVELVTRLKRQADRDQSSSNVVKKLWPTVKKWGARLKAIDESVQDGQHLLEMLDSAGHLIG